jgi:prepilin-type N-terminal cleavage/methylation domain-containing protein
MHRRANRGDAGFTLIEVLTALAVVGVVAAASTTFFIRSMITVNLQGTRQAAIQVAADAMEQLRAVPGSRALDWITANATQPEQKRNGLTYQIAWSCVDADSAAKLSALISCTADTLVLQPEVTVTYQGNGCPAGGCAYSTNTRISTYSVDPIFKAIS